MNTLTGSGMNVLHSNREMNTQTYFGQSFIIKQFQIMSDNVQNTFCSKKNIVRHGGSNSNVILSTTI